MRAARIHCFGPPEVIQIDDIAQPTPGEQETVVRVAAAGVGPWDALIRERKSVVNVELPLILGSDLSGHVEAVGAGVTTFKPGDEVYGVTNPNFIGAYAEYAVASAPMMAKKPTALNFAESASAPVVAVTAWQMLFDYAQVKAGQSVLIHGAAGNVGAYAVQMAAQAGVEVYATASAEDLPLVRSLGAGTAIDYRATKFEDVVPPVDAVLDMVGGETKQRSFAVIKPGGILVSVVSQSARSDARPSSIRSVFFLVQVTTERLNTLTALFDSGKLHTRIGTVLPLRQARTAHEMLAGAPHASGKIVLAMG
jgi:NADPH:quinone reductase-like Zn-dependent oxidoreductase